MADLVQYNSYANKKFGTIINQDRKYISFRCKYDHKFKLTVDQLTQDKWCDICETDSKLHVMYIQDVIDEKGGRLYTDKITSIHQTCMWLCSNKHIFNETLGNVFYKNKWCPYCPVNFVQLLVENILDELISGETPKYLRTKAVYKNKPYIVTIDYFYKNLRLAIKYNGIDRAGFQDFITDDTFGDESIALEKLCKTHNFKLIKIEPSIGLHDLRHSIYRQLQNYLIPVPEIHELIPIDALFEVVSAKSDNKYQDLCNIAKKKKLNITISEYPSSHDTKILAVCSNGHRINISPRSIVFMDSPCILCLHDEIFRK